MNFKTKQNLILIFTPLFSILTILFVIQSIVPSYAEEFGQLTIDVRFTNGDRASAHNVMMKIYHEGTDDLYTQLKPNSEYPHFVAFLPIDQEFRIDAYLNGMYSGSYNVDIINKHENIDFTLPVSSGIKFQVLYDDKYTPIEGASLQIKNHEGKILHKDFTDKNGKSLRFWTAPTIVEDNYYEVEISIAENINYTYSQLHLTPGERKDLKITTPWHKIIKSPITILAYKKDMTPLTFVDGKYVAELYDKENNKVAKSNINNDGEAYFSLIPLGDYRVLIKDIQEDVITFFANQTITIENNSQEITVVGYKLIPPKLLSNPESIGFVQQGVTLDSDTEEEKIIPSTTKKPEIKKLSCNCVAFRLDDVQDYWLNDVQIEILEVFENRNSPITIGIIGDRIGNDQKIISYINTNALNNSLEIANHGWQHEDFTLYNKTHQSSLIQKTNEKIQDLFRITPSVFIPPFNSFNENTTTAMLENGITHFSSEFDFSTPPYPLVDAQLYSFPVGASTGELYLETSLLTGINHKLTLSQIKNSISEYGFAVVMMHPQDFSVIEGDEHLNQINWNQIRELELLLDRLKIQKLDIVPISKIDFDLDDTPKLPQWVQQISQWWSEGKISDEEYASGIKFYQDNGIISI